MFPWASIILARAWGKTFPTVVNLVWMLSVVKALKQVGEASVRPRAWLALDCQANGRDSTIATSVFSHIQFREEPLHEWPRDWGPSNDACAEV